MFGKTRRLLLLGLVFTLALTFTAPAAYALTPGQKANRAVVVAKNQLGKPYEYGTDGPNTFSCSGLMRYVLRTVRTDANAPWTPERYLKKYRHVTRAHMRPGDIVIYRDWATIYVGNGVLISSNAHRGHVARTRMVYAGKPLGIVRPY